MTNIIGITLRSLLAFTVTMTASAAMAASLPPPIDRASDGGLQCYAPNPSAKSCQALAGYRLGPDGVIYNTAVVLIAKSPIITMQTVTPVTIKDGKVCGTIEAKDIAAAQFTIKGVAATPGQTTALRQTTTDVQQRFFGHEICTAYRPVDGAWIADASMDGTPRPEMRANVTWVSPSQGYEVRP
jgi:hypothetical protein